MKIPAYIFLLLIFSQKAYSQTYSNILSDKTIEELMVWEIDMVKKAHDDKTIGKKKINRDILPWQNTLITLISNPEHTFDSKMEEIITMDKIRGGDKKMITELFSDTDMEYLKRQYEDVNGKEWTFKSRKGTLRKNPKVNYYSYSKPLFDKAHTKAIIYKEFYCGSLCAIASIEVYIKNDSEWRIYKSILLWVS